MKVLVTGGAGFIGSHIVDLLLAQGNDVTVLDNLSTGRTANLDGALKTGRCTFIQVDVAEFDKIKPHFEGVHTVYHIAALADIVPSIQRPLDYYRANVDGTVAVVEAARLQGVKRLVYAASSSCYGLATQFPTPETAPINPKYPYALTKYLGEQTALHWGQVYHLPVVSLRFFNVYGPRARTSGTYGAVFGVFLKQILEGKPCTIVGDGMQTRDFTYVTDVANAVVTAGNSTLKNEIVNVGSGNTYSINDLVDQLGGEKVYIPKRPGEPDCTFADTTKIARLLSWKPQVSFAQGVKNMVAVKESWRDAPLWTESSIADATKDWHRYLGDS
jgi:UDP-glucose 4-epimerase